MKPSDIVAMVERMRPTDQEASTIIHALASYRARQGDQQQAFGWNSVCRAAHHAATRPPSKE